MSSKVDYTIDRSGDVEGVWEVWLTNDGSAVEYLDHFCDYREAQAFVRDMKDSSSPLGLVLQ